MSQCFLCISVIFKSSSHHEEKTTKLTQSSVQTVELNLWDSEIHGPFLSSKSLADTVYPFPRIFLGFFCLGNKISSKN